MVRAEKFGATTNALVDAVVLAINVLAAKRRLSPLVLGNLVLLLGKPRFQRLGVVVGICHIDS